MNFALGCAFNVNELFINFPIKKIKFHFSKINKIFGQPNKRIMMARIFKTAVELVLKDIIENNTIFKLPGGKGEIKIARIQDDDFKRCRKIGKFRDVDFIASFFTGHQLTMYMYTRGYYREKPIYVNKKLKDRLTELTNQGKQYG